MNPDLQTTHKPDGSQHGLVSHRSLSEDVLQTAAEAAKAEVFLSSDISHNQSVERRHGRLQHWQEQATSFVVLKPMKASLLAAGAGAVLALLALLMEQGLKRRLKSTR
jgi:hypothetical protein